MNTERTSSFLMANLGSEVSRILSAKKKSDLDLLTAALERASVILAQLKEKTDMQARSEEITTLDEVIRDTARPTPVLKVSAKHLQAYFLPFMMRVMG